MRPGYWRQREIDEVIGRALGTAEPMVGNKLFHVSDFMAHHTPACYVSLHMHSTRTLNAECLNGENTCGHYLGEGSNFIVQRGDEYDGIFPVWNWNRVPGTTTNPLIDVMKQPRLDLHKFPQWADLPENDKGTLAVGRLGRGEFVGGASDGKHGVATMDFKLLSLTARKSWFFFDRGFVALGAGITDSLPGSVVTTVNQCRLAGPVQVVDDRGSETELKPGKRELAGVRLVHHDGIAYLFPPTGLLFCENQAQSGSWRKIAAAQPDAPVSMGVFTLGIEHGMPLDASYAYECRPGITFADAAKLLHDNPIEVLANTPNLQAVRDADASIVEAVFCAPGSLVFGANHSLKASAPCTLIVSETTRAITFGDPSGSMNNVEVEFDGQRQVFAGDSRYRRLKHR